ncbi:uncharacterized protein LOC100184613 [Ciona intestinalis]
MGQIICCFHGKVESVNEQTRVYEHPAAVILAPSSLEESPPSQPQSQTQENQPSENAAAPLQTLNFTEVKIVNGTFPTKPLERPVAIESKRPKDAKKSDNGVTRKAIVPPVDDHENSNSTNNFNCLRREQEQESYSPDIQPDSFTYIDADGTEPYNSSHDTFPKDHGSPMKVSLQSCSTAKSESMESQQMDNFRPDSRFTEMASPSPAEQRRLQDTMNPGHLGYPENISMQTLNHESTDV